MQPENLAGPGWKRRIDLHRQIEQTLVPGQFLQTRRYQSASELAFAARRYEYSYNGPR